MGGSNLVDVPAESRLRSSSSLPPQLFVNSARAMGRHSLPRTADEGGSSSHDMIEWRATVSTDCETCWQDEADASLRSRNRSTDALCGPGRKGRVDHVCEDPEQQRKGSGSKRRSSKAVKRRVNS